MRICPIWILFLRESLFFVQGHSSILCFRHRYGNQYSENCNGKYNVLSCNKGEVIMINAIQYAMYKTEHIRCKQRCFGNVTVSNWEIDPVHFRSRLYQLCSKQNNCSFDEDVKMPIAELHRQRYFWSANISYDCVDLDLFNDMCSTWDTAIGVENETVHVSLNESSGINQQCSCIIEGDAERTSVTLIDYRPNINDYGCAKSYIIVNGNSQFGCSDTSNTDPSLYNTPINLTDTWTNITVLIHDMLPQKLWIAVKGLDVTIQCNTHYDETTQPKSMSTSVTPGVKSSTQFQGTESVTEEQNEYLTTELITTNFSSQHDSSSGDFPTSVVAGTTGGFAALVIVVITAVILYRRRLCTMPESKGTEAVYYNQAPLKAATVEESGTNGGIDTSNDNRDGLNTSDLSPNGQDKDSNTDYIIMNVGHLKGANTKRKDETNTCTKQQTDNRGSTYRETYFDNLSTVDNERGSNYSDVNKYEYYNQVRSDDYHYQNI